MSKKKKIPASVQPIPPKSISQPAKPDWPASRSVVSAEKPLPVRPEETAQLIDFNKRLKWFIGICIGLFLLLTLAKIHYSSLPYWNQVIPDGSDPKRGLISGKPRPIRMDEWAAMVPFTLSQANQDYPVENMAIGGEKPALVLYLPVKHFIMLFRPDYWGFFISTDFGLSWRWNFMLLGSLIVTTLLFLILTRNNFWVSVCGAVWLLLSPGFAWWSFSLLTSMISGGLLLISSLYLFYAQKRSTLIWAGLLFVWSLIAYALNLYPPYQVSIGYLLVFILIGFVASNFRREQLFSQLGSKAVAFAVAFALIGFVLYQYYVEAKATIDVMSQTVYPGKRSETGGTGFIANWFSEYYAGWLLDDQRFPKGWLNICELSHFVTFTPVIAVCMGFYFVTFRKIDPLLTLVLLYVVLLWIWIEVGYPAGLAKLTLMDMSPTRRTQIPFGIGNVVLAVLYLGYIQDKKIALKPVISGLLVVGVVAFMVYAAWLNLNDSDGFYKAHQLFLPTAFFLALNFLMLPVSTFRYKEGVIGLVLVLFSLPNLGINPVSKGTAPLTQHVLYQKIRAIHERDPTARWVVLGSQYITYLVTATGVNQLSGIKYLPDFKTMRVLDPTAKRDSAYNRYAHTVYSTYIDGRDSIVIQNTFEDGYQVALDPCSPRLKKLNTKYFVFDRTPQAVETRCLKLVDKLGSVEIYRINE
ncbi:DUF7657 domain-containing protein [Larkinella sp.]|uniref:DUF7657 domain-containing protein n=1 Tax=Larkinella sp. TaxID=2034517 RepID=UPI003BAB6BA7